MATLAQALHWHFTPARPRVSGGHFKNLNETHSSWVWVKRVRVLQPHLEGGVDAADQGVQDVDALVSVEEDEGEEGLQQGRLRDTPQEEVQVRRGGHHLLQGQLLRGERGEIHEGGGDPLYRYTYITVSIRFILQIKANKTI